jgi:hypothetical protein
MADEKTVIRIGHFSNMTHVHALVAHNQQKKIDAAWTVEPWGIAT